jgi:hypothetical protein
MSSKVKLQEYSVFKELLACHYEETKKAPCVQGAFIMAGW